MMTDPPTDLRHRSPKPGSPTLAPDPTDAKHHAPLHGHTGHRSRAFRQGTLRHPRTVVDQPGPKSRRGCGCEFLQGQGCGSLAASSTEHYPPFRPIFALSAAGAFSGGIWSIRHRSYTTPNSSSGGDFTEDIADPSGGKEPQGGVPPVAQLSFRVGVRALAHFFRVGNRPHLTLSPQVNTPRNGGSPSGSGDTDA
eukprot:scaffold14943_cov120-Isochrysis_galbana.AAC.5